MNNTGLIIYGIGSDINCEIGKTIDGSGRIVVLMKVIEVMVICEELKYLSEAVR